MTADTDSALLDLLSSSSYVSGQAIARELHLSRTAVWKRINRLRDAGFLISSRRNRGYRIDSTPDRLLPALVSQDLTTKTVGRNLVYLPRIDSTNRLAKDLAVQGIENGSLVLTEHQSHGQGRLKRTWISPYGKNLLFSIIFYPPVPPVDVFSFTLFTSLAVTKALREETGIEAGIKWPNDIYVRNRKICGVLTEFSAHQDRVNWAVVGVGININVDPSNDPTIRDIATSVRRETGKSLRRVPLLQRIVREIDEYYERFLCGEGPAIRAEWITHSIIIGKSVIIMADEEKEQGIAHSIDEHGALMLETEQGHLKRIVYGDLSLRMKK